MLWLQIALIACGVIVALAAGALLWFTRRVARGLLRPTRKPLGLTPQQVGLTLEDTRISGPRGELAAWYLPARNGRTLICCHGINDNRSQWLEQVARLHERGYGAVLFDFAGHGHSDGDTVTYGVRERDDVAAIITWLRERGDVDMDGLAIMGYSLGAITATLAAATLPELRALVIESGFADLQHDIAQLFTRYTRLPAFPMANMVVWWAQRMADVRLSDIRPAQVIGQISPRPALIISDLADGLADEPYDGERLYAAAGEPKELWQVADAPHVQAYWRRPEEWVARVGDFLDRHLAPVAHAEVSQASVRHEQL